VLNEEYIEQLSDEDKEIADQINRRTEFQVLSIDYHMY
jgi:peptidoglycan-associated lipoprotein